MTTSTFSSTPHPGLPDPASVVFTETLPHPRSVAPGAAMAGVASYRVLRTTQIDEYEQPVDAAGVAPFSLTATAGGDTFQGTSRKAAKLSLATAQVDAGVLSLVFLRSNCGSATMLARSVLSGWL